MTSTKLPRSASRACRNDAGAAAVELAILLPVFLGLTLAAIDFGLSFRQQLMLRNAASNAATYASVKPCDTAGIDAAATTELQNVSVLRPTIGTPQILFLNSSGSTGGDCTTANQVEVTLSAPYSLLSGTFLSWFGVPSSITVSGHETVRIEGR